MAEVPPVHYWLAGDAMTAVRMNEIKAQIDWLRNPPVVHVARLLTAQTGLLDDDYTIITFDTVVNSYDPYDMWDAGDPTKVTAPVSGWYTVFAQYAIAGSAVEGRNVLGVFKNGSDVATNLEMRSDNQNQLSQGSNVYSKEGLMYLNEGDYVLLGVFQQDAGRSTVITALGESCNMRVRWASK